MVNKVDGGGLAANTRREEPVAEKPEVKPGPISRETPQTNAAIYTNRSESTNQANFLRTKLNAQFTAPATAPTPPVTPEEAAQKAEDIIKTDGGKDKQTFSDWYQGIDRLSALALETSYGAAFNPSSAPEEAAAALKSPYKPGYDPQSDVQAFTDQLEAHRGDPRWVHSYFAALGSDKTAELIGSAATPAGYSSYLYGGDGSRDAAEMYNKNMDIIGDALEAARKNGGLSQTDMNNLVASMKENGFNPNVALDMFGKASTEVRELFVRSTIADGTDPLAAAGSYVLAGMPGEKQAQILGELDRSGLRDFIQSAMAGQSAALDMSNYLATGLADKQTTLGGIAEILSTANRETGYDGSTFEVAPFSDELKTSVFDAVTEASANRDASHHGDDHFEDAPKG